MPSGPAPTNLCSLTTITPKTLTHKWRELILQLFQWSPSPAAHAAAGELLLFTTQNIKVNWHKYYFSILDFFKKRKKRVKKIEKLGGGGGGRERENGKETIWGFSLPLNMSSSPDCGIQESGNSAQSKDILREERKRECEHLLHGLFIFITSGCA